MNRVRGGNPSLHTSEWVTLQEQRPTSHWAPVPIGLAELKSAGKASRQRGVMLM